MERYPAMDYPPSIICDPRVGYRFLRGLNSTSGIDLVGSTPDASMAAISLWVSQNIKHERSDLGHTMSLSGRLQAITSSIEGVRVHYISAEAGCFTVSALIYDLARSINIPLLPVGFSELEPNEIITHDIQLSPDDKEVIVAVLLSLSNLLSHTTRVSVSPS